MSCLLLMAFLQSIESLGAVHLRGSPGLPVLLVHLTEARGWAPEVSYGLEMQSSSSAVWNLHLC